MSASRIAIGALGLLGLKLLSGSDPEHHDVVEETYESLEGATPNSATVYADHLPDRDVPHPRNAVDGLTHIPDVVVKSGITNSLLVEVETATSLADSPTEAKRQLADFSKQGYRRLLVVPEGQENDDAVQKFVADIEGSIDGDIHLTAPSSVATYL